MDSLVFAESVDSESSEPLFTDKQWLYVNDSNNGSYTGQIVLDSTSLSNSGAYMGWNEAFLAIPLVLQIEGDATNLATANPLDFALAMKSGYWQILHSMSVEFNNGSVVQTSSFLNVFSSFKNLTSWSDADIRNWGAITGFCPDTATSWIFNSLANQATNLLGPNGLGFCNNRNAYFTSQILSTTAVLGLSTPATTFAASKEQCVNLGMLQRQRWLNFSTTAGALTSSSANKIALLGNSSANLDTLFMSYVTATNTTRAIVFDAVIRLKDVCDFFNKCPLLKGSTMRIYLNTNQTFFTANCYGGVISAAGAVTSAGNLALASSPIILGGGATCPIMLASSDLGQGLMQSVITPGTTPTIIAYVSAYKVGLSICKTQFDQFATKYSAPIQSVRLYCPAYTMTPQAEARYLAMSPTKKIVYNDFFQYNITGVSGDFNQLVSNGLPNLRSVLVVPTIEKSSNGSAAGAGAGTYGGSVTSNTLLSPFSSTGGTPDPIPITQFQVQLSGKNSFIQNEAYDYEQFFNQLVSSNQLNGSLTTGLGSGQIGFTEFENLYRYYYVNAGRGLPQDMGVAKSVQIQGNIKSSVTCTLLIFCEFERSISVNVASGQRIE